MGTLWNTYAFYVLYANIDKFNPSEHKLDKEKLTVMDKWLLSKLNTMVLEVDDNLSNYRIPEAARALQEFVDGMSNWYVRRCRERYWVQTLTDDKITAYMTLYTALVTTAKTAAPLIPFLTESIYQNLVRSIDKLAPLSIHLCSFPEVQKEFVNPELEEKMDSVLEIVVLGRAARNGAALKNRQPLSKMFVKSKLSLDEYYTDIIKDELNIKEVEFTSDVGDLVTYQFKPQLKTVGPKYGKQLGDIRNALAALDGTTAKKQLDENGVIILNLPSGDVTLSKEDLLIEAKQKEGYYTLTDNGFTVAINTVLTDELIEEGFIRELISKIQTMRKEAGFNVTDHINVTLEGSEKVISIALKRKKDIIGDTLADTLENSFVLGFAKEWDINGETVTIGVEKI